tara:strand:+ start:242 stop:421 length:180 start_codon:yes stop_codon:yes gene_type:complete
MKIELTKAEHKILRDIVSEEIKQKSPFAPNGSISQMEDRMALISLHEKIVLPGWRSFHE